MRKRQYGFVIVLGLLAAGCGSGGGSNNASPGSGLTNTPPVVAQANSDQSAFQGYDFSYDANQASTTFQDSDGDALTFSVTVTPNTAGLTVAGTTISGTPNQLGDITAMITAIDPSGASVEDSFTISVGANQAAISAAFGDEIDLEQLQNYAAPDVPDYIGPVLDNGNPVTDAGATLGRVLFYDTALSINDTISCGSCHRQELAFSDNSTVSTGVLGGQTARHSMRLINVRYHNDELFPPDSTNMFWDQRADSPEMQATMPLHEHNEHGWSGLNGRPDIDDLITKLEGIDYYEELFRFVFLDPEITEERLQLAISQFVKSIVSFDSRWDQGVALAEHPLDDFPNFTADENAGKTLFSMSVGLGGAHCAICHLPPEFNISNGLSGHNGVVGVAGDPLSTDFTVTRSPSLRDLFGPSGTLHGPMMHDGSLTTPGAMIAHYNNIPVPTNEPERSDFLASIDPRLLGDDQTGAIERLGLNATERQQLISFLRTLTGDALYTDEKWSDPF